MAEIAANIVEHTVARRPGDRAPVHRAARGHRPGPDRGAHRQRDARRHRPERRHHGRRRTGERARPGPRASRRSTGWSTGTSPATTSGRWRATGEAAGGPRGRPPRHDRHAPARWCAAGVGCVRAPGGRRAAGRGDDVVRPRPRLGPATRPTGTRGGSVRRRRCTASRRLPARPHAPKQELLRSTRAAATQGAVLVVSLEPDRRTAVARHRGRPCRRTPCSRTCTTSTTPRCSSGSHRR